MTEKSAVERACLSAGETLIQRQPDGSFRIGIPVCRSKYCFLRVLASDLGLQADERGLFLMTEDGVSTELEARAYLAAWRFFANRLLAERRLWAGALDH